MEEGYPPSDYSFSHCKYFYLLIIIPLGIANSSDATEILCLSYILSDSTFQSNILQNASGGSLAGSIFAGMLLGGILLGLLGESPTTIMGNTVLLGRRRPWILVGLFINAVAGFSSAFTSNIHTLTFIRSVAGLGIGISVPPLFTLVSELSPPTIRGFCITLVASFWMMGSLFVAALALLIFSHWGVDSTPPAWRVFAMLCSIPSFIAFILVFIFVPESPRYLLLHGRWDDAQCAQLTIASTLPSHSHGTSSHNNREYVDDQSTSPRVSTMTLELQQTHPLNNNNNTLVSSLDPRISHTNCDHAEPIIEADCKCKCICLSSMESLRILYCDGPLARGTTIPLNILWFSLCFGSYGLFTWINSIFAILHLPSLYIQSFLFALANLPGNIASACLVDRIRRKTILISSMLLSALSLIILSCFTLPIGLGSSSQQETDMSVGSNTGEPSLVQTIGIVLSACSFQACIICAWNMIDCITSESFPTTVRNSGMALCTAWGRIGAMVAQFVNGFLLSNNPSPITLLLIASVSLLIGSFVPFWMTGEDMMLKPLSDSNNSFRFMTGNAEDIQNVIQRKRSDECNALIPEVS